MSETILHAVFHEHASPNLIYHCLGFFYFNGYSRKELSGLFSKSPSTITHWITRFERTGSAERESSSAPRHSQITPEMKQWVIDLYRRSPLLFLDEAQAFFVEKFKRAISLSTVCRILRDSNFTLKVVERHRAIQICMEDVYRFFRELSEIPWFLDSLCFLDESGCDNRGSVRKRGYCLKGEKLILVNAEFTRGPRTSMLCFLDRHGLRECYTIDGTFDRSSFTSFCRDFALSGKCETYPGRNSVWIMDGASIHRHPDIVRYLRCLGIVPFFLPAYCPFFNPIEFMFGLLKKRLQRLYLENSTKSFLSQFHEALGHVTEYDMTKIFHKCGYVANCSFDMSRGMASAGACIIDMKNSCE